jgi:hypothetical protein
MTSYLLPLIAIVLLCAFWALFQQWLSRIDPDAKERSLKCGGCGRRRECDTEGHADRRCHSRIERSMS